MTSKQGFAIFCKTGFDVRNCNLTEDQVQELFILDKSDAIKKCIEFGAIQKRANLVTDVCDCEDCKKERKDKKDLKIEFKKIFDEADNAGKLAVEQLGEISWYPCGFAQIRIKPANSGFSKWLLENNLASKSIIESGIYIWVSQYNQSMIKKETYASAFAEVLRKYNIKAYSDSRID